MDAPQRLRVGITGATGFIGQRLIESLGRVGHYSIGFTRTPERYVHGCVETRRFAPGKEIDLRGLNVVVNLAGEPVFGLWTKAKKRRILASRRDGTRTVVDEMLAAGEKGPKVLINASAIGFYGDTGDREIDELTPAGSGFLSEVTQIWEQEALRAETGGIRVVILRIGLVLGKDGGALKLLGPLFKMGLGAKIGSGKQWVSWVHVSDVARLAVYSIENPHVSGVLNATAPTPVRSDDFTEALARKFNRRVLLRAPEGLLRSALGDFSHSLLDSQRVLPRRTQELGYYCQYKKL
jgi:uncharacterized protein (TIGR01777 family)